MLPAPVPASAVSRPADPGHPLPPRRHPGRRVALTAALLLATSGLQANTVLLNDTFGDSERLTQAPPAGARWIYSGEVQTPRTVSLIRYTTGDELQLRRASPFGQAAMVGAFFTPVNAPQLLADGDSVVVAFTLRLAFAPNSNDVFQFGLFNSKGERPTQDMSLSVGNISDSRFRPAQGYHARINPGATTAASFDLYKRDTVLASTPFNNANNTKLAPDNLAVLDLPLSTKVPLSMQITRNGNALTIVATVNGRSVTRVDDATTTDFAFDMVGFFCNPGLLPVAQSAALFDDFVVEYRPATGGDAGRVTLLADRFDDGDRANQALPASARWFFKGSNAPPETPATQLRIPEPGFTTPNDNIDLIYTATGGSGTLTAPFTPAGAPLNLAVGDSLTARFSLRYGARPDVNGGLRVGLFDSGGSRPAEDFTPASVVVPPSVYSSYRGLSVALNPGATAPAPLVINERTGSGPALFADSEQTALGATPAVARGVANGVFTRGSLKLTRLDAGTLRVETAFNGVTRAQELVTDRFSFDTFGLHVPDGALPLGDSVRFDDITVLHTPAAPTSVATPSTLLSEDFTTTTWADATFAADGVAGSVTRGATGTIDNIMGVVRTPALRLGVAAAPAAQPWSATLRSPVLPIANTETALGLLTFAFDLRASSARPVTVGLESYDAAGVRIGRLEHVVYPAAPNSYQRFVFELDQAVVALAGFDPTAPGLRLTFAIAGGDTSAAAWAPGDQTLDVDNLHYARPAYYVKPSGNDAADGRTAATAFRTPGRAVQASAPGDIVLFMSDPALVDRDYLIADETQINNQGIYITTAGRPAGWITFKNHPGHTPRFQTHGWRIFGIGTNAAPYSAPVAYIEFRGLSLRGVAYTALSQSYRGQVVGVSNTNALDTQGRNLVNTPHHLRFADNHVFDAAAAGITIDQSDFIQIENNLVHDNSLWTRYATSGISILQGSVFDPIVGEHRFLISGNRVYGNECREIWAAINALSDGNGIIVDSLNNSGTVTRGPYPNRTLIQNNVSYDNGGGGIHIFRSDYVDVVNNTAYGNNQIVNYGQINHSASSGGLALNNIMVATGGRNVSGRSNGETPDVPPTIYRNNLYVSSPGSPAPGSLPGDSGNLLVPDMGFVNIAGADFRLTSSSPALGFGLAAPLTPVLDHDGLPRGTRGGIDAGAFTRQPVIVDQPVGATAVVGAPLTLTVGALSGVEGELTYQWQRDGVPVAGATSASLAFPTLSLAQAGTYRVVVATPFDSITSTEAVVIVRTAGENWRQLYFGTTANAGAAADNADPDGDGVVNLLEYAYGGNPVLNDVTVEPTTATLSVGAEQFLTLTFRRNLAATDVSYTLQASGDLQTWTDLDPFGPQLVGRAPQGADAELVTVRDTVPLGTGAIGRFLRVRVNPLP